jgi:hypothetical protein
MWKPEGHTGRQDWPLPDPDSWCHHSIHVSVFSILAESFLKKMY